MNFLLRPALSALPAGYPAASSGASGRAIT